MTKVNVYITFDGNCEEAFHHYKSVFGGEFESVNRFGEMPSNENYEVSDAEKNKIMHITLPISAETMLMGSDNAENGQFKTTFGNNFSISIHTDTKEESDRLFNELSNGGQVFMPMNETFWGSYFGMFADKFGIQWMINCAL